MNIGYARKKVTSMSQIINNEQEHMKNSMKNRKLHKKYDCATSWDLFIHSKMAKDVIKFTRKYFEYEFFC